MRYRRLLCGWVLACAASVFSQQMPVNRLVVVHDTLLYLNGSPVWLNGANTPWDNWNDFGGNYSPEFWDNEFAALKRSGANITRIWMTCNGDGPIQIDTNGIVTGMAPSFWEDCDDLFAKAQAHGIYVLATLISFDHTKLGNRYADRFAKMYQSTAGIDSFVDNYVVPFVQRYEDNPYVAIVEPCNEIEWVHEAVNNAQLPWSDLRNFVAKVAAAAHAHSPDLLVTLGLSVKWQCEGGPCVGNMFSDDSLRACFGDHAASLDIYSPHWYNWVVQSFGNPFDQMTPGHYGLDDKPAIIGECPGSAGWVDYVAAYENGWRGTLGWTSNGVDALGSLETGLGDKIQTLAEHLHPSGLAPATAPSPTGTRAHRAAGQARFDVLGRCVADGRRGRSRPLATGITVVIKPHTPGAAQLELWESR